MLGTVGFVGLNKVYKHLQAVPQTTMVHVIYLLLSAILARTEEIRWVIDYATQAHEARTGIASLSQPNFRPFTPEQLKYDEGLQVTLDFSHNLATGSEQVRMMLQALIDHLAAYQKVRTTDNEHKLDHATLENLIDACKMKIELARCQYNQIERLIKRLIAQEDITKVLIAQRDAKLTIKIADATLQDSQMMRSIARVTMIFFPATFMATFSAWCSSM